MTELNKELDGTWKKDFFSLVIKGESYISFYNGFPYGKGTITYDHENFTVSSTHSCGIYFWVIKFWRPFVEVVTGKYRLENDEVLVFSIEGRYDFLNGTWVRGNCTSFTGGFEKQVLTNCWLF